MQNAFGQKELTPQQQKNLFFQDLRLVKNLLMVKYMNARNEGRMGAPDIKYDMSAQEAYDAYIADTTAPLYDAALVALNQLKKEYK